MNKIVSFIHYLAHLEWKHKVQTYCVFCDRSSFDENIIYEDNNLLALNNRSKAGRYHWLIIPKSHKWRDIEGLSLLNGAPIVQSMIATRNKLLEQYCPTTPLTSVHTGFHRGRRVMLGNVYWPDIISIHHLHMHVIVEPRFWLKVLKYPPWLPIMWKSEKQVEQDLKKRLE
ncbi:hypothetical protein HD806DRAFT_151655 [Xylariaceae sp. AK1471]|nr:hypothetical protein HD806DRAFT_151655 [Xylariaceae sp. AK1471]